MKVPFKWICRYCGHAQTVTGSNYGHQEIGIQNMECRHGDLGIRIETIVCSNPECGEITFRMELCSTDCFRGDWELTDPPLHSWQLLPESEARPQPDYIPEPIRRNYREACLIGNLSPNASAAMSRRCLQGMIRDFWGVQGKNNLWGEIKAIKNDVDPAVWEAIDAVRQVGNIGAHMEKDANLLLDVEPDEARSLIELIEMLLAEWYVSRHERERRVAKVSALSQLKGSRKNAAAAGGPET